MVFYFAKCITIVSKEKKVYMPQSSSKSLVSKPWGSYQDYYRSENCVFKIINVRAGEEISYQLHNDRDEFWYVLEGQGKFNIDGEVEEIGKYDACYISANTPHQVTAITDMVIAETQIGVCSESDIVRLNDKYNR